MKPWIWTILKWLGVTCMVVLLALAAREVYMSASSANMVTPETKSKNVVVIAVGLPASGKSTWFEQQGVKPLSGDEIRLLLFDDAGEQRHQDTVFSIMRYLLHTRLRVGMPKNYIDVTNLTRWERSNWVRIANDYDYETQAVFFSTPLELCLKRNRNRERQVPEHVMLRMAMKLEPPTIEEGFSKVVVVSS